jgi:hypothetical protein
MTEEYGDDPEARRAAGLLAYLFIGLSGLMFCSIPH